ncbi:serine/threonine-protein kinase STE20-like isoform X2 [Leptopilina heterotoma]|uniref:serine/threonine-protein kinase STE20-like isoform X2 n=1 Tax=Leptopilina heterotoma TaxID=63436 RepID=UPI001CA8694F|nr:serine/threonine-protein kinase STE20-like isoform X2 [Leptopilina heterotoma]
MPYYGDGSSYYYGNSFANHSSLMTGTGRPFNVPLARFSPHLSTISESPLSNLRRYSPVTIARRPRRTIDTADIDVSTPRTLTRENSHQRHHLRRDRPTIKIRSQALKDNPALREHYEKHEKNVGEMLVEKFLIKEKKYDRDNIGGLHLHNHQQQQQEQQQHLHHEQQQQKQQANHECDSKNALTEAIQRRVTRRFTRRRSSADVQLNSEQLERELAYAQVQAEVLDTLVAEEQAEMEVEARKAFAKKKTHRPAHNLPQVEIIQTSESVLHDDNDDELSRIRKKVKKKKKSIDKLHLPTNHEQEIFSQSVTEDSNSNIESREDEEEQRPIQKFKVEACNSVGDFSTLWIKTSPEIEAKTGEQFRESVRLPAPKRLPVSNLETEAKIVLPIPKTYIKDNSRNSVYLTVKKADNNSSQNINQSKISNHTSATTIIDHHESKLAKIDSKDTCDTPLEVKNISDTLAVSSAPNVRKSLNTDAKDNFRNTSLETETKTSNNTLKTDSLSNEVEKLEKIPADKQQEQSTDEKPKELEISKPKQDFHQKVDKEDKPQELIVSSKDKVFSKENNTPRLESPIRAKLASKDRTLKSHPEGVSSLSNEIPTDGIKSPVLSTNDPSFSKETTTSLQLQEKSRIPSKKPVVKSKFTFNRKENEPKGKPREFLKIPEKQETSPSDEVTPTNEIPTERESDKEETNSEIDFWSEIKSAKMEIKRPEPLDLSRVRESLKSFDSPSASLPTSGVSTPLSEISQTNLSSDGFPLSTDTSILDDDDGLATPTNESITTITKWNKQDNLSNLTDLEKDLSTLPSKKIISSTTSSPADSKKKKKKIVKRKKSKNDKNDTDSVKSSTKLSKKKNFTPDSTMKMSNARSSPRDAPCRPSDLMRIFYTTPRQLMTATPRDLRKVRRVKVKKRKPPPRNSSISSDSTGSTTSTQSTNTSAEDGCNSMDELEQKRMASTRSNDSGFDGSPRLSTPSQSLENHSSDNFHTSGRITPPATNLPRFKKYAVTDFNFLKVLGKGSFGKVLLAELRGTECIYAVKCLKKDVVLEDDDVECTLIERKVLTLATRHPYLCHLFCTFQTESHLFFVMEYLNGGDLMFHIQKSGRFSEARARFYAAEIWSGLNFLHKKGIVYRDLKLDNVLLDFEGHIRIADFGMCKLQIFLDRTADTFCGTPDYMAPEIIKGLKYNQAVDWWSFGILLYEMLTGQSPFSGCDEEELFWSICNERPFIPRYLSQDSTSMLICLLEKDSGKRLPAHEIAVHPFFQSLAWDKLERRQLEAPFKPAVEHTLDTRYFDTAFTAERPRLTAVPEDILTSMDQNVFRGFSYTNPNATD